MGLSFPFLPRYKPIIKGTAIYRSRCLYVLYRKNCSKQFSKVPWKTRVSRSEVWDMFQNTYARDLLCTQLPFSFFSEKLPWKVLRNSHEDARAIGLLMGRGVTPAQMFSCEFYKILDYSI